MEKYTIKGRTALITGASSGIGEACAKHFASLGVNLVITARRFDRLQDLARNLSKDFSVRVTPFLLDVQRHSNIAELATMLASEDFVVDILVNNAGLALSTDKMQDAKIDNWDVMIDTNIKGLLYMTRAFLPSMIARNQGHIINIGSVAGHDCYTSGNVYCATKHAVRAISKSLRMDLFGSKIRVSEIDPGAVETEFSEIRWQDQQRAKKLYQGFSPLVAADIADAVVYCATRPPHVNIAEMIVYPQAQASISQIFREDQSTKIK